VLAAEPDGARAASAAADYGVTVVSLHEGLDATGLVFDATAAVPPRWDKLAVQAAVFAVDRHNGEPRWR